MTPRVIIRHKGPQGDGVPEGGTTGQILSKEGWINPPSGTGAIVGPGSSVNNRLVAFDGITGALAKDSGILISEVATVALANTKEDKVTGKGLSQEDFTTVLKAKLDALTAENYRGQYAVALDLTTAVPAGNSGDYALVGTASTLALYVWDTTGTAWVDTTEDQLTATEIVALIFNATDAAAWSLADTRILTQALYDQLVGSASLEYVNSLALAAGLLTPAYGQIYYFDMTGTVVAIASSSDGSTNMVPIAPTTILDTATVAFDSPSPGRLRYTGAPTQLFGVSIHLAFEGPGSTVDVVGVAKNGSVLPSSKLLQSSASTAGTENVGSHSIVSLSTNDYIEIYIGNTTNNNDITVFSLGLQIHAL